MDKKKLRRGLLFALPFAIGLIGFLISGKSLLDALFSALSLYPMQIQDSPPNWLVELARWAAPVAAASGLLLMISKVRNSVRNWFIYRKGDSVAVYGPEAEQKLFLEQLDGRGIEGGDSFVRARQYVLLDSEEKNFLFYRQNRQKLAGRDVYLQCASIRPMSVRDANLRLFSAEETASRLFWKQHCLYESAKGAGWRLKLVFIGFGRLGSELLDYALLDNLFSPEQCIEYHVFSTDREYPELHPQLANMEDKVFFHSEPWQQSLALLEEADRILVLQQEDQTAVITSLLLAAKKPLICVFTSDAAGAELLEAQERLLLYPWREIAQKPEYVLSDQRYDAAKRLNLRYAHLYSNVPETEENKEAEWVKLNSFTRYSNISPTDYHEIQVLMLRAEGKPLDPGQMTPECLELLSELEHMRWCRYHWLNNWSLGTPEGGRNKDFSLRIHVDLKPYSQLSDKEKEKDRDNIRLLFSMDL